MRASPGLRAREALSESLGCDAEGCGGQWREA